MMATINIDGRRETKIRKEIRVVIDAIMTGAMLVRETESEIVGMIRATTMERVIEIGAKIEIDVGNVA